MKRPLIILGMIAVVILLGISLYFLFKPSAKLTVSNGNFGDASSGTVTPGSTVEAGTGQNRAGTVVAPNLIEITAGPVSAGEVAFDIAPAVVPGTPIPSIVTTGTSTNSGEGATTTSSAVVTTPTTLTPGDVGVHYIDRESGNVYEYLALSRKLSRISSKPLPGIQEASWVSDGSEAVVRFLSQVSGTSHVATYAMPSDGSGGYFFQQDLDQATVIGSSTVFILASNDSGSTGSTGNADGTNIATVFTSPLSSIKIYAAGAGLMAVTKATSELDGYAFSITKGVFTPFLGPLKGLTILPSPSGKNVLYSYVDSSSALHMAVLNLTDGTVINLPLATLAEKCVWTSDSTSVYCGIPTSVSGNIPDDWYQGTVSFTDRIWRIDLSTRLATLVVDPSTDGKTDIDAVNLTLDPNSQVLVFRNKKDGSLWAYTL